MCSSDLLPNERKEETHSEWLARQNPASNQIRYSWPQRQVLVVEDTQTVLYYLRRILELSDVKCLTAVNGREAVDICRTHRDIDLVLMDLQMPVMNGYEATSMIKKFRPELPIVAQTAYAYASEIDRALADGCDSYLVKPLKKSDLLAKLAEFFGPSQATV